MLKLIFVVLALALPACTTVSQPEAFRLSTGEVMECLQYKQTECGMTLLKCGHEHSIEFECMSDVHYIGVPVPPEGETK